MKKVKVVVEAFVEVPDDQTEAETMDKVYKSGFGSEEITRISLPGVVRQGKRG